ncbi:MAG: AAA family ATPase [Chloroflexaceae bacterium]|nr:AAA family ATPase [Chloroflexaceae bacterium]
MLDVVWWALTGTWAGAPAWPQRGNGNTSISWTSKGAPQKTRQKTAGLDSTYQAGVWNWDGPVERELTLYARSDNSFSVWDVARSNPRGPTNLVAPLPDLASAAFHLTPDDLWNGLEAGGKVRCKGLISDWLTWQYMPQHAPVPQSPFALLTQVLKQLSPHPGETIEPGQPMRVSIEDVRDIPTIDLPYGNIPIIYASAGMKRIIGFAYLLVWAWYEHQQASFLRGEPPTDHLILLIDEVEAHLHPRWQRSILPALLDVATALNPQMHTQIITTTHSPLVLASVEPFFDVEHDKLFLFDLHEQTHVNLQEIPWAKQGDTVNWLVSAVFGLKQARSWEAEQAIEAAEALMRGEQMDGYPEHLRSTEHIHAELLRLLPGHDPFWPRWIITTQRAGA